MTEDREAGFVVLQRRVRSSDLWRSLRGDQRSVFIELLLLANWAPRKARWKGEWYEVHRGELSHSLATIAREANTSVKVVRTTLSVLMADDTPAGGNGPAVTARYPISGTGPGTGPRVLTIVNYGKYQDVPDDPGTDTGKARARVGHGSGTERTIGTRSTTCSQAEEGAWTRVKRLLEVRVRGESFARWFAPLVAAEEGTEGILLAAPSEFHARFVQDNYAGLLAELAGRPVQVAYPHASVGGVA